MDPITVLLTISGGSIVLLFCLYSAIALYWYLTEDDATTYQTTLGATDTNRTKNDSPSTERHRRRQRRR